jgi:hypothetical protein
MTNKLKNPVTRRVPFAIAGCAICCAPLVVSFVLGMAGAGGWAAGQWLIGGILLMAALYFVARRRTKTCDCAPTSIKGGKCCG